MVDVLTSHINCDTFKYLHKHKILKKKYVYQWNHHLRYITTVCCTPGNVFIAIIILSIMLVTSIYHDMCWTTFKGKRIFWQKRLASKFFDHNYVSSMLTWNKIFVWANFILCSYVGKIYFGNRESYFAKTLLKQKVVNIKATYFPVLHTRTYLDFKSSENCHEP